MDYNIISDQQYIEGPIDIPGTSGDVFTYQGARIVLYPLDRGHWCWRCQYRDGGHFNSVKSESTWTQALVEAVKEARRSAA